MLFHNRRRRIYAAFAGTFINLLMLVPFGFLWWFAPEKSMLRYLGAVFLLLFNAATFANFIPFIELDGYFMLSYALGMVDLRKESHRFWIKGLRRKLFKKAEPLVGYERRDRYVYLFYGFCSLVFTAGFLVTMAIYWYLTVKPIIGDVATWSLLLVFTALILYKGLGKIWER